MAAERPGLDGGCHDGTHGQGLRSCGAGRHWLLFWCLMTASTLTLSAPQADDAPLAGGDAELPEEGAVPPAPMPDRIKSIRFARAFGRLSRNVDPETLVFGDSSDASLPDPEEVRQEVEASGLEVADWLRLLERMRDDEDFRRRIERQSRSHRLAP